MNVLTKIRRVKVWTMLAMCLFGLTSMAGAADGVGIPGGREPGPPFRAGEVAVYATPQELPGQQVLKFLPHAGISVIVVEPGREMAQVQSLRSQGRRAGLNHVAHAFAAVNDPYYTPYQWHLTHIQSESAWDLGNGSGATVAVLDTGLKPAGPDGINCVVSETDIVNGDNDAADGDGHGTHVSGTIAQNTDNGYGVAGMAYGACVMPVPARSRTLPMASIMRLITVLTRPMLST
jgi:serine protease